MMKHKNYKTPISFVIFRDGMREPIYMRHMETENHDVICRRIQKLFGKEKIPGSYDVHTSESLIDELRYIEDADDYSSVFLISQRKRNRGIAHRSSSHVGFEYYWIVGENPQKYLLFNIATIMYSVVDKHIVETFSGDYLHLDQVYSFDPNRVRYNEWFTFMDDFGRMNMSFKSALLQAIYFYKIEKREKEFLDIIDRDFFPNNPVGKDCEPTNELKFSKGDIVSSASFGDHSLFGIGIFVRKMFDEPQIQEYEVLRSNHHKNSNLSTKYDEAIEFLDKTGMLLASFIND